MLPAMPPRISPTFAVVSASIRPSRMSAIARAAATMALRPSSGAIPECAARPMKRRAQRALCRRGHDDVPDRRSVVVAVPEPARCRRPMSNGLGPFRPTSSIGVSTSSTPACVPAGATSSRTAASMAATAALLSAPRIVVLGVHHDAVSHLRLDRPPWAARCRGARSGRWARRRPPRIGGSRDVDVPDVRADRGAGVVLVGSSPSVAQEVERPVGHRPLAPGRAGDRRQLAEQVEHGGRRGRHCRRLPGPAARRRARRTSPTGRP